MIIEYFIQNIMLVSFIILFLFYFSYFIILYVYYRKIKFNPSNKNTSFFYPSISIIFPVYNEEKVLDKQFENIKKINYPKNKIEIIFVDGNSTDNTVLKIKKHIEKINKKTMLIQQNQRNGYNNAIAEGIAHSKSEIIMVSNAGVYYEPNAVKHLVKNFKNRNIGAITGKQIVLTGQNQPIGSKLEEMYRTFYDFMRISESQMDSTPDAKGEILAIRKDICISLVSMINRSVNASFDCCVPYHAKLNGFRTLYKPEAKYYEYAPATFMDRMKHQTRRASFLIGSMLLYKNMLLNKKYGVFSLIIMPAHFLMLLILPWLSLLGLFCFCILSVINPIWLTLLIISLPILLFEKSRIFLISFIQSQIALMLAMIRVAKRRDSLLIDTISSTRIQ